MNGAPLLDVEQLDIAFAGARGQAPAPAVDGLSFEIRTGETLALVGESGCGKSTTALALMGLLDAGVARVSATRLRFAGTDLLTQSEASWRALRGGSIGMIFQDPLAALNPVRTIGQQIAEALKLHRGLTGRAARSETLELLREVGIPEPARRVDDYPHRLSGGMRQRVVIAMALAGQPRLLIADEPTTALDVTIQAQILALLARLQQQTGMALLLITHDLGIVGQLAHRVAVMYAGRKIEERSADALFDAPAHPYTQRLLAARPQRGDTRTRLAEIAGSVPLPGTVAHGCAFAPRCTFAQSACHESAPAWRTLGDGGLRCILDTPAAGAALHDRRSHAA
ncbi:peptide/nickel transport system ATP-binding protein [Paraburkholderia silvatlantica]|uniref:Peptide/nickel transport system ATP-binding protein n=1 Tax=Paraburkholderia silvatlantica TaxID=321895 RepID=A0A2V4U0M4_9BURK|nr:ABC transporter ATP-binding protein [Paraburkholderia silvatlantica]PYE13195.1 peptide/nickel transport system ATP-binding protein [Paraburkholderia silvatlantica]